MTFNNETCWPEQMIGRKDGANAIKNGDGYYFNMMKEWGQSEELKAEYPNLSEYLGTK